MSLPPAESKTPWTPAHFLLPLAALLVLHPKVPAAAALGAGVLIAVLVGNPYQTRTCKWTHVLLQLSVVALGAGIDLREVARAGLGGLGYTAVGIVSTLLAGALLGRLLRVPRDTSLLITVGTAICGGSAIAAVAPVLRAKDHEVSVALATVFLLNSAALLLFPPIGHLLGLSEPRFGLWAAVAIHDTSSVVGAALAYGPHALQIATTVKLARALWIIPLALGISALRSRNEPGTAAPVKRPWFILGFLIAAALFTYLPVLRPAGEYVTLLAKRGLVLTLLLIGANLSPQALRRVGVRPLVLGLLLWALVASVSLGAILFFAKYSAPPVGVPGAAVVTNLW
jgi:uncharacterized integral membrane protein (TIGR00698 family)